MDGQTRKNTTEKNTKQNVIVRQPTSGLGLAGALTVALCFSFGAAGGAGLELIFSAFTYSFLGVLGELFLDLSSLTESLVWEGLTSSLAGWLGGASGG